MTMLVVLLLCINFTFVVLFEHGHGKCIFGQKVLNDCNWCSCKNGRFECTSRNCRMVDMFGHFNDAIADLNVGIEGHGVFRSSETSCDPGVTYMRQGIMCICSSDGSWPNPACRDVFQVMHHVEESENSLKNMFSCTPNNYYLTGCNVCYCSMYGRFDPKLCTHKKCSTTDPVLNKTVANDVSSSEEENVREVYAECKLNRKYQIKCRECICLKNNRLLCGDCKKGKSEFGKNKAKTGLSLFPVKMGKKKKKPVYVDLEKITVALPKCRVGKIYKVECNLCLCMSNGNIICTKFKCDDK